MILQLHNSAFIKKDRKENTAFGIQNWLYKQGYVKSETHQHQVDAKEYRQLINDFCRTQEGFDPTKAKSLESLENYVNSRWEAFQAYCKLTLKK